MTWFRELSRPCAQALWGRALATLPDPAAAFGPRWRERPAPDERTWAVVGDSGRALGVGSLRPCGGGAVAYCVCLLPEACGRGLRLVVRRYLVDEAFRDPAVREVRAAVLLSNLRHLDQRIAELRGGIWEWRGVGGDPPEATFVVARERWEPAPEGHESWL